MQKDPIVLKQGQTLKDASRLIKMRNVRHLPVVDDNNRLIGIVTDRDVKKASASGATTLDIHELFYLMDKVSVEDIMTRRVYSVHPSMPLEQAAKVLHDRKFGCLPVVDNQKLVGILTTTDVMQFLMDAMNVDSSCTRVELRVEDKPKQLFHVLEAISEHGYQILSVISSPEKTEGTKLITFHLLCEDDNQLRKTLEGAGFDIVSFFHQEPMKDFA
ncbi:MAG: CBS domain-containing protein [SAR324 cluster bacterium]|nr:CBS domain-containing protein [SAR324 cluster bacterium]